MYIDQRSHQLDFVDETAPGFGMKARGLEKEGRRKEEEELEELLWKQISLIQLQQFMHLFDAISNYKVET